MSQVTKNNNSNDEDEEKDPVAACHEMQAALDAVFGQKNKKKRMSFTSSRTKPKKGMKQIKLKKAFANMKQKNFQGYDIEKCTAINDGEIYVYLPQKYGKFTRKKFRGREPTPPFTIFCNKCNLVPCSMLEYQQDLEDCLQEKKYLSTEDNVRHSSLEALRTRYRSLIGRDLGKKHVAKFMPQNDKIPQCALHGTMQILDLKCAARP